MDNSGVTCFVEDVGEYYQDSAEGENVPREEDVPQPQPMENLIVPDADDGNSDGEVTYVVVVEDNENLVNVNIDTETDQNEEQKEGDAGREEEQTLKLAANLVGKPDSPQTLFTCTFCKYNSNKRSRLNRHMVSHAEERPHKCCVCDCRFKTTAALLTHTNKHDGVQPFTCSYCRRTFTSSGELVRHVRYKHTREKPYKCPVCDYASVELSTLRRHERCHTGEKPHRCPHCVYSAIDRFNLKRHILSHTGEKPFKCDQCEQRFTQASSLKAHKLRIHSAEETPVYPCELCPATCRRMTELRIHLEKMHTSKTPVNCKRCGMSFPDRYSCKVHIKTHEGEKRFACNQCPYATKDWRSLKSHLLRHKDEKPFACVHCDHTFRQKQLLSRHVKIHHTPGYAPQPRKTFVCNACERVFAYKGTLIRHLATHDPDLGGAPARKRSRGGRKFVDAVAALKYVPIQVDEMQQQELVTMKTDDMKRDVVTCFGFDEVDEEEKDELATA